MDRPFDTFNATHLGVIASNGMTTAPFEHKLGVLTFDLGAEFSVDAMAFWSTHFEGRRIDSFMLFSDNDNIFDNGTTANMGSFIGPAAANPLPMSVFTFAVTNTRFVHLDIISNCGAHATEMGEFAFRAIPEPSSFALLGMAVGLIGYRRRR